MELNLDEMIFTVPPTFKIRFFFLLRGIKYGVLVFQALNKVILRV